MTFDDSYIGVALEGTLAFAKSREGPLVIGAPVPIMLQRVQTWLEEGKRVKIFTARVAPFYFDAYDNLDLSVVSEAHLPAHEAAEAIQLWCEKWLGIQLPITCMKDMHMTELWDDRAVQVVPNTGLRADGKATN